jgi:excisionase family DNA binding protein
MPERSKTLMPRILTRREAACYLRITLAELDELRRAGEVPFYNVCGNIRIVTADVEKFLLSKRVAA